MAKSNWWYYTPLRIAKAYPSASPYCWISCGSVGSLLHIFWSCSILNTYWDNIFNLIESVTQIKAPKSPEFALLLVDIDTIPLKSWVVVCNILHSARLSIARHWKTINPATSNEVIKITSNIYIQERKLAWHKGKKNVRKVGPHVVRVVSLSQMSSSIVSSRVGNACF